MSRDGIRVAMWLGIAEFLPGFHDMLRIHETFNRSQRHGFGSKNHTFVPDGVVSGGGDCPGVAWYTTSPTGRPQHTNRHRA